MLTAGGCYPIGMKKKFPVYIEETAILHDMIAVSAGVRGTQSLINTEKLVEYADGILSDLC